MARKKRKLTEEQRQAAIERLAKARKKRGEPAYTNYDPYVVSLPDDHPKSLKKVREWIKENKEKASSLKSAVRQNVKGAEAQLRAIEGYVRNCEWYLRTGDWIDDYWGSDMQNKTKWRTIAPAYDKDGLQKPSYSDLVRTDK